VKARITIALIFVITTQCVGLFACGDKFLVPNRGSRSQLPTIPRNHEKILVFDSGQELQRGLKGTVLEALTKAGFSPSIAAKREELIKQLTGSRFDAVLVSIDDAPFVSDQLLGKVNGPVVIPVAFNMTDAEAKATRKLYPVVLRIPARNDAIFSVIDKALAQRRTVKQSNPI
jgi:DNA-binding NtrC family response regulator